MNNENMHNNTYILDHKKAGYKNDQCGHGKGEN